MSDTPQNNTPDYKGFNLKSVCWGYRDIFRRRIERLFREGLLGEHRREVTETFFEMLLSAGGTIFDDVLQDLIEAINARLRWILALQADLAEPRRRLANPHRPARLEPLPRCPRQQPQIPPMLEHQQVPQRQHPRILRVHLAGRSVRRPLGQGAQL